MAFQLPLDAHVEVINNAGRRSARVRVPLRGKRCTASVKGLIVDVHLPGQPKPLSLVISNADDADRLRRMILALL